MGVLSMAIVTSTIKGQIVIPAGIRRKYGIVKGTPMNVYDQGNKIVIEPIPKDLIQEGRGVLMTKGRVLKRLMKDRKEESEL
jgi:AbrB family looped-hinge helix DNA binding protein